MPVPVIVKPVPPPEPLRKPAAVVPLPAPAFSLPLAARGRFAVIALAVLLLAILTGVIIVRLARSSVPAAKATVSKPAPQKPPAKTDVLVPAAAPSVPEPEPPAAKAEPAPSKHPAQVVEKDAPEAKPANAPSPPKPFNLPQAQAVRAQAPVIQPPPGPVVAANRDVPGLPANFLSPVTAPVPPARAPVPDAGPAPRPAGGHVTEPKLIRRPTPVWPAVAKARGIYGTVKIQAIVDKQGNVTNVKVTSGNPILATVAKDAVLQSRYEPGKLNGEPTETPVEIQIVFAGGNR